MNIEFLASVAVIPPDPSASRELYVDVLEYEDCRPGGFEPIASLPDDATVALGLVSTKWVEI